MSVPALEILVACIDHKKKGKNIHSFKKYLQCNNQVLKKKKKAPSNKPSVNLLDNFFMWCERLSKRVISCPTPVQETRAS